MLFSADAWSGLLDGSITETYRRWKRPQAVVGNRYRTPVCFIVVDAVDIVGPDEVPPAFVLRGDPSLPITRVRFHRDDDHDPRAALADDTDVDVEAVTKRLDRMDAASSYGPWTRATLDVIATNPACRAADLAARLGRTKDDWKRDVRKLKELGLTLSLDVGYRLSPRGEAYLGRDAASIGPNVTERVTLSPIDRSGRVIVLNGTSSAGKTTLAEAVQARFEARGECWFVIGIDDFLAKLPPAWLRYTEVGETADDGVSFVPDDDGGIDFRTGPVGAALLAGYRGAVAAMARAGCDLLVDEVLVDDDAWAGWLVELGGLAPFWVRVDCPVEVCEAREAARGDRLPGLARSQAAVVHRHPLYDLAVDTSTASPVELAERVVESFSQR